MCKYTIYSSTTDPNKPLKNPSNNLNKVYNKGTNNILERTSNLSYECLYALLIWVDLYNCLFETYHGNQSAR